MKRKDISGKIKVKRQRKKMERYKIKDIY